MYSFRAAAHVDFAGDIVLDMFNGSGATTLAAKVTGRRWIGIDLSPDYCDHAEARLKFDSVNPHGIMLEEIRVRGARDSRQLTLI